MDGVDGVRISMAVGVCRLVGCEEDQLCSLGDSSGTQLDIFGQDLSRRTDSHHSQRNQPVPFFSFLFAFEQVDYGISSGPWISLICFPHFYRPTLILMVS